MSLLGTIIGIVLLVIAIWMMYKCTKMGLKGGAITGSSGLLLFLIITTFVFGIGYASIFSLGIMMLFAAHLAKGQGGFAARFVAATCAFVILSVISAMTYQVMMHPPIEKETDRKNKKQMEELTKARMAYYGQVVGEKFDGFQALVLVGPRVWWKDRKVKQAGLKAFLRAVKGNFELVNDNSPVLINEEMYAEATGLDLRVVGYTVADLDRLLKEHTDYDLVILIAQLPRDYERLKYWRKDKSVRAKFVIIKVNESKAKTLIANALVTGAFLMVGDYSPEQMAREKSMDADEIIRRRYQWVDAAHYGWGSD